MILQRCKELVKLDVRDCCLFDESDGVILELTSHIPLFSWQGSSDIDNSEDREVHIGLCQCDVGLMYWNQDVPFNWNSMNRVPNAIPRHHSIPAQNESPAC